MGEARARAHVSECVVCVRQVQQRRNIGPLSPLAREEEVHVLFIQPVLLCGCGLWVSGQVSGVMRYGHTNRASGNSIFVRRLSELYTMELHETSAMSLPCP